MSAPSTAEPLVSVVTITYQHAPFIERNVQGVLVQRTSFPVEHLIGEDESTDGTREICQRLAAEHPDTIRLFLRSRKDVMYIMGRPTGRANQLELYRQARGKYIAVCPGDDYWIDPDKLQQQVDLMERRPVLSGCFTNAWDERNGEQRDYLRGWLGGSVPPDTVCLPELISRNYVPSQTFLFRRDLLYPLPDAIYRTPVGDYVVVAHLALKGCFGYIDRHTAVRRHHGGGIISMKSTLHKIEVNIGTLRELRGMMPEELWPVVDQRLADLHREGLQEALDKGDRDTAGRLWKDLRCLAGAHVGMRERLRNTVLVYFPTLAKGIHAARTRGFRPRTA